MKDSNIKTIKKLATFIEASDAATDLSKMITNIWKLTHGDIGDLSPDCQELLEEFFEIGDHKMTAEDREGDTAEKIINLIYDSLYNKINGKYLSELIGLFCLRSAWQLCDNNTLKDYFMSKSYSAPEYEDYMEGIKKFKNKEKYFYLNNKNINENINDAYIINYYSNKVRDDIFNDRIIINTWIEEYNSSCNKNIGSCKLFEMIDAKPAGKPMDQEIPPKQDLEEIPPKQDLEEIPPKQDLEEINPLEYIKNQQQFLNKLINKTIVYLFVVEGPAYLVNGAKFKFIYYNPESNEEVSSEELDNSMFVEIVSNNNIKRIRDEIKNQTLGQSYYYLSHRRDGTEFCYPPFRSINDNRGEGCERSGFAKPIDLQSTEKWASARTRDELLTSAADNLIPGLDEENVYEFKKDLNNKLKAIIRTNKLKLDEQDEMESQGGGGKTYKINSNVVINNVEYEDIFEELERLKTLKDKLLEQGFSGKMKENIEEKYNYIEDNLKKYNDLVYKIIESESDAGESLKEIASELDAGESLKKIAMSMFSLMRTNYDEKENLKNLKRKINILIIEIKENIKKLVERYNKKMLEELKNADDNIVKKVMDYKGQEEHEVLVPEALNFSEETLKSMYKLLNERVGLDYLIKFFPESPWDNKVPTDVGDNVTIRTLESPGAFFEFDIDIYINEAHDYNISESFKILSILTLLNDKIKDINYKIGSSIGEIAYQLLSNLGKGISNLFRGAATTTGKMLIGDDSDQDFEMLTKGVGMGGGSKQKNRTSNKRRNNKKRTNKKNITNKKNKNRTNKKNKNRTKRK